MGPKKIALIVLLGLPGSGKTSFCRKLIEVESETDLASRKHQSERSSCKDNTEVNLKEVKYIHIWYDLFESWMKESYVPELESVASQPTFRLFRRTMLSVIENVIQCLTNGVALHPPQALDEVAVQRWFNEVSLKIQDCANICMLVDDNMYYQSMRYECYQLCRKFQAGFGEVYMNTDLATCMFRNSKRHNGRIDEQIILRMSHRIEPPNSERLNWESNFVEISHDVDDTSLGYVNEMIKRALCNPVPPAQDSSVEEYKNDCRQITSQELLHQADLITRKLVKAEIERTRLPGISANKTKEVATRAARAKQSTIAHFKDSTNQLRNKLSSVPNASEDPNSPLYQFIAEIFSHNIQLQH